MRRRRCIDPERQPGSENGCDDHERRDKPEIGSENFPFADNPELHNSILNLGRRSMRVSSLLARAEAWVNTLVHRRNIIALRVQRLE